MTNRYTLSILLGWWMAVTLTVACISYDAHAQEERDGRTHPIRMLRDQIHHDGGSHSAPREPVLARCRPPRGLKCQRPARTPQEHVRRTLNRNGHGRYWDTWSRIIACESGWNPYAVGAAGELGLAQIHPVHGWLWSRYGWRWSNPADNTLAALYVYRQQGWSAWSCW